GGGRPYLSTRVVPEASPRASTMKRTLGLLSAAALLALPAWLPAQKKGKEKEPSADLGKAAAELAQKLGGPLVKEAPKGKGERYRVAVFPFGNAEGKVSPRDGRQRPRAARRPGGRAAPVPGQARAGQVRRPLP